MSMFGCISVSIEMERLLKFMNKNKDKPAEEQIEVLLKYVKDTKEAADSGWL